MFLGILYAIFGFIETTIALRFVLRFLGANPANELVNWIYEWSTPFVRPFAGMFGQTATATGPGVTTVSVFDWTALIALVVYGLVLAFIGTLATRRRVIV